MCTSRLVYSLVLNNIDWHMYRLGKGTNLMDVNQQLDSPQICDRQKGCNKCSSHSQNNISIKCKECGILICIECVSSTEHQGHTFVNLNDCYKEAKDNLNAHVWKLENNLLPQVRKEIIDTDVDLTQKDATHDNRIKSVQKQWERTIEEINKIFTSYTTLIDEHAQSLKKPVYEHKQKLESIEKEVLEQIAACKDVLVTENSLQIYDDEDKIRRTPFIRIPKPTEKNGTENVPYIKIENSNLLIEKALMILEVLKLPVQTSSLSKDEINKELLQEISSEALHEPEEPERIYYAPADLHSTQDTEPLKYEGNISFQFQFKQKSSSLCPITSDSAWVKVQQGTFSGTTKLTLINNKGKVKQNIKVPGYLLCLGVHPVSRQLYGGFTDKTVKAIDAKSGRTTLKVDTDCVPYSIAINAEDRVIVGNYEGVSVHKYKLESGALACKSAEEYNVYDISLCPLTNHVVIACDDEVVVFDTFLATLFKFTSTDFSRFIGSFTAIFDANGSIFVGDHKNKKIHILDGKQGQFAHSLTVDVLEPVELRLYGSILWVSCRNPDKVVLVKLTKC